MPVDFRHLPACRLAFRSVVSASCLLLILFDVSASDVMARDDLVPSFRQDVMPVLSRSGCNLGTCHGGASGKGGLKLSLRGQDPDDDFRVLTRELSSRRVNIVQPDQSLLLLKPLMEVPHEGGRRFEVTSHEYQILNDWIAAGLPGDPDTLSPVLRLTVTPTQVTVVEKSSPVKISAVAHFSDGSTRDVTHLAVYSSSSIAIDVSDQGQVSVDQPGLTTVTVRYLEFQEPIRIEIIPDQPDFQFVAPEPANVVDEHVFRQLQRLRINPSTVCSDSVFIRRAWLDLTGQLPPANVAKDFVASTDSNKRAAMIDRLLASEGYVDQQTMYWADLLRVEEKTLDETGLKVYHQWIRNSIASGKPLNEFISEIIAARGSTYKVPPANFYRALRSVEERSETVAQVFLGVRLTCAKCHNHPFDQWTQDDYYDWSNFFGRIDYEIIENKRRDKSDKHEFVGEQIVKMKPDGEIRSARTRQSAGLRFLGEAETAAAETDSQDRLQLLAAWLTSKENHRFAATQANRIWYQLMGRGIVDPIDDFRATNPPVNKDLLDELTSQFIRENFDVRSLTRTIMMSRTYQLSSEPNPSNQHDELCFSRVVPQRLTSERMLDAVSTVLETDVPFGGHEPGTKAVQLIGVRNGEFRYARPEAGDDFLKLFGRPSRLQSCECERSNDPTLAQTFEMVSGELISGLMSQSGNRIVNAVSSDVSPEEFVSDLYWAAVSRPPSSEEQSALLVYIRNASDLPAAFQDVTWAVLNCNEFLLRH